MARKNSTTKTTDISTDISNDALNTEELQALHQASEQAAGAVDLDAVDLMILNAAADVAEDQDTVEDQNQDRDLAQDLSQDAGDGKSFAELLEAISEEQANHQHQGLLAAFSDRAQYEHHKNPENYNIQKTLSRMQKRLTTPGVVRAQVAAGLKAGFLNTSESLNSRRNVYALEKVYDLLYAAVTGHMKNAINRACVASMVALEGKLAFTGLAAKAAASDKVGITNDYKGLLKRHTVSESTASTQASSTMTALEDLGVVKNTGTRAFPVYEFVETPLTARLKELGSKILVGAA